MHRSLLTLLLLVSIVAVSVGSLTWLCRRSPDVNFLPRYRGAEWIQFPIPPDLQARPRYELSATFSRTFSLRQVPKSAPFTMRAFRRVELSINGQAVRLETSQRDNWKRPITGDVAAYLQAGENRIEVVVTHDAARPALWLKLALSEGSVVTDRRWQVSIAGLLPVAAPLASDPLSGGRLHIGQDTSRETAELPKGRDATHPSVVPRPEQSLPALVASLPQLAIFASIAVAVVGAAYFAGRRRARDKRRSPELTNEHAALLAGVVAILWGAMAWNNHGWLHPMSGPDSLDHLQYIQLILANGSLPLPGDGIQTHQPPLFYLLAAGMLRLAGATAPAEAMHLIRLLTVACGIAHVLLVFASLRLLFPERPSCQIVGLVLAAFLPVHLFVFQYATNETLTAALASGTIYLALRILKRESPSLGLFAVLGAVLGAALLTKITALVVAAVVVAVLAARGIMEFRSNARAWTQSIVVMVAAAVLVCGWHYARMTARYGTPLVRYVDLREGGGGTWYDPGSHTAEYFWRFGRSLVVPFFAGFDSFGDAVYSTMWGDGRYGGSGYLYVRVPWNYQLMAAGYLLALVPSLLIALGAVYATIELIRRPDAARLLVLGLAYTMAVALVYENLRHPYLITAKAWYGLLAAVPLCACGAIGFDWIGRWSPWLRAFLCVLVGTWAINAYASFWILGGRSATFEALGFQSAQSGQRARAQSFFERAVAADPRNVYARAGLAGSLSAAGRFNEAEEQLRAALEFAPDFAMAHATLAHVLTAMNRPKEAVEHYRRALAAEPDDAAVANNLAWLLATHHDPTVRNGAEAVRLAEQVCRLHELRGAAALDTLAAAYAEAGRFDEAVRTTQRAIAVARSAGQHRILRELGEALADYRAGKPRRE